MSLFSGGPILYWHLHRYFDINLRQEYVSLRKLEGSFCESGWRFLSQWLIRFLWNSQLKLMWFSTRLVKGRGRLQKWSLPTLVKCTKIQRRSEIIRQIRASFGYGRSSSDVISDVHLYVIGSPGSGKNDYSPLWEMLRQSFRCPRS